MGWRVKNKLRINVALNKKVTIEKIDINKFISYSSNILFMVKEKPYLLQLKILKKN